MPEGISELHKYNKPSGQFIVSDPIRGVKEYYSASCCHCGFNWWVIPGSGRKRGWCMKCMHLTCGKKECMECVPRQDQLNLMAGDKKAIQRYKDTLTFKKMFKGYEVKDGILIKR